MTLTETAEERTFRRELRAWLEAHIPERLRGSEAFEDRREVDRILAREGYIGYTWPTEYGGRGADPVHAMILDEELGRLNVPQSRSPSRFGVSLVGPALIRHGTPEQKARFLPRILAVEDIWCQGFSEPNAGSDLANVQTTAEDRGDHLILNGGKIWTTQAQYADWIFVLARTDPQAPRHKNLSYLLVPMRQAGIEVRPLVQLTRESEFNQVFFRDVPVPKENVLGGLGNGWAVAMTTLASERSYGQTSRYRVYQEQLRRLAALVARTPDAGLKAAWTAELGQLYADVEGIGDLGFKVVSLAQAGEDVGFLPSVTKLWWSETHQRLADLGFRVASVVGDRAEQDDWTLLFLQTRAETIYAGTSQIQRNIIAERILGLPR